MAGRHAAILAGAGGAAVEASAAGRHGSRAGRRGGHPGAVTETCRIAPVGTKVCPFPVSRTMPASPALASRPLTLTAPTIPPTLSVTTTLRPTQPPIRVSIVCTSPAGPPARHLSRYSPPGRDDFNRPAGPGWPGQWKTGRALPKWQGPGPSAYDRTYEVRRYLGQRGAADAEEHSAGPGWSPSAPG